MMCAPESLHTCSFEHIKTHIHLSASSFARLCRCSLCVAFVDKRGHWAAECPTRGKAGQGDKKGGDGKGQGKKGKAGKGKN